MQELITHVRENWEEVGTVGMEDEGCRGVGRRDNDNGFLVILRRHTFETICGPFLIFRS